MIRHRAFIRYPFADAGDFADYNLGHDAVLVTQEPMATLCFYRDELVGFLPHEPQCDYDNPDDRPARRYPAIFQEFGEI